MTAVSPFPAGNLWVWPLGGGLFVLAKDAGETWRSGLYDNAGRRLWQTEPFADPLAAMDAGWKRAHSLDARLLVPDSTLGSHDSARGNAGL